MNKFKRMLAIFASTLTFPAWGNGNGYTVGVIDGGFDKNYSASYARSACFSTKDTVTSQTITTGNTKTTNYTYGTPIRSKCPNLTGYQQSSSGSSAALNMPLNKKVKEVVTNVFDVTKPSRPFLHTTYQNYYDQFIIDHGTNVLNQVRGNASSVKLFPVVIGHFIKNQDCISDGGNHVEREELPQKKYFYIFSKFTDKCKALPTFQITAGLRHINKYPSGVITVNISIANSDSRLCSTNFGFNDVAALNQKGIAVIASVGNTNNINVQWPACLPNVIGVAQTNKNKQPISSSIKDGKYDFFAIGEVSDFETNNTIFGTSYAAPKVAGAYATLKSINPNASITDITRVLKETGTSISGFSGKLINLTKAKVEIRNIGGTNPPPNPNPNPEPPTNPDPTQPPTPPGQRATLGITDNTYYTNFAKFSFDLNGDAYNASSLSEKSSTKAGARVTDLRDIKLTFDAHLCSGKDPSTLQGVDILVNGVRRHYFHGIRQGTTSQCYNYPDRRFTFMLNRNWLKSGENTIEMHRRNYRDQFLLGATNIRMDYNPPETLRIDRKDTKLYGHRVGTRKHLTGLRVEFASTKDDLEFTATGYDIDSSTEIAVFLNYKLIGYLTRGSSSRYNAGDTFLLEKENFVSSGINTIEFVQTSSSDRENWGVVNMELTGVKPPNISGAIMLLLSD